jgi:hypothetical protein
MLLGRNRARSSHGPCSRRWRGPRARPSSTGPRNARRRRCSASWRRHGAGARETAEERAAHQRGNGGAAWSRRASGFGRDGGVVGEAVGTMARLVRRSRRRHGWRGGGGDAREAVGAVGAGLSGRAMRCPDSGLKSWASGAAHGSHEATARCHAGLARCAVSDRWGPLISDF